MGPEFRLQKHLEEVIGELKASTARISAGIEEMFKDADRFVGKRVTP